MRRPNLEAMIEAECVERRGVIHLRNSTYKYILDQLVRYHPFEIISSSELHAMVDAGMREPSYSMLAHEVYRLIKQKYMVANFRALSPSSDYIDNYAVGNLRDLLESLLEGLKGYEFNLPG